MAPKEGKEGKEEKPEKNRKGGKGANEPPPDQTEDPPEPTSGCGKFYYSNGATYEGEWIIAPDPNAELAAQSKGETDGKGKDKKGAKGDKTAKDDKKTGDDKKQGDAKSPPKSPKQDAGKDKKHQEGDKAIDSGLKPTGEEQEKPRPNRFRHGKGVYSDGEYRYEGEWKEDQMCGQGTFKYASGATYEGNWEMNKYFGKGEYKWGDGRGYKGDWRESKMHGMGVYTDIAGHKYVGHFFNGIGPGLSCEIE